MKDARQSSPAGSEPEALRERRPGAGWARATGSSDCLHRARSNSRFPLHEWSDEGKPHLVRLRTGAHPGSAVERLHWARSISGAEVVNPFNRQSLDNRMGNS